jgi:hypothetical protein
MAKASHEEAQYRSGRLGRRCGNCSMFRDVDMRLHEGGWPVAEGLPRTGEQGRDEYDEPPMCTVVVNPISVRDVCDYFEKLA